MFEIGLIDLTGQTFGRLTVVERVNPPEHVKYKRASFWKCQCSCGNTAIVRRDSLVNNKTRSCGCIHDEVSAQRLKDMFTKNSRKYDTHGNVIEKCCSICNRWLSIEEFAKDVRSVDGLKYTCKECTSHYVNNRYKNYRGNAKHRKINFLLSLDEFDNITKQPCFYCGQYSTTYLNVPFCGIDRVDSNKGYTAENCVPCCEMCNQMKSNYVMSEWLDHINKIAQHMKNKMDGDINVQQSS